MSLFIYGMAVVGAITLLASLVPYLLWHFGISLLCRDQDLKKRYNASWALVTGASSGAARLVHGYPSRQTCVAVRSTAAGLT